jgi:hypothetical protein
LGVARLHKNIKFLYKRKEIPTMGKGRRNRERNLQDRLANPAAKNLKNKKIYQE